MNLGDIESVLYERFGFGPNPDSAVTRRFRRYINQAHREILGKRGFLKLRRRTLPASSVANSPFMVLPHAAVSVAAIVDRSNGRPLDEMTLADQRFRNPRMDSTVSRPYGYTVISYSAAAAQDPSAAASLFVKSDDAADGSGLSASVEGVITGGYFRRASVTMSGLTAVNVSSAIANWTSPTKFYLSGAAKGNVTLNEGSGSGTELACITPGRAYSRYTLIQLIQTPSSALTYYCDVELHVDDMVNPKDEPLLPEDFHDLLEIGATKRGLEKQEKTTLWKIEDSKWRERMADLRAYLGRVGGVAKGPNRGNKGTGWSQLGWNYPAGT